MYSKIIGEQQVQILSPSFSISPSNEDYVLNISANGRDFSPLFAVAAGVTRLVSNVAPGSYYKLVGNQSEVIINWQRICVTEGGGSGTELEPVTEFPVGVPEGTVVAYAGSASATGIYQYVDNEWVEVGGGTGSESVIELTQAEYEALTNPDPDTLYIITDADAVDLNDYAPASGLTELSGTVETLSSTKADKQNVTANTNNMYFPIWNNQGVITGSGTRVYGAGSTINGTSIGNVVKSNSTAIPSIYAPTSAGTAGQPLLSNGSGAPVWGGYKFAFMSQTDYDALTTKDATTIYFITEA